VTTQEFLESFLLSYQHEKKQSEEAGTGQERHDASVRAEVYKQLVADFSCDLEEPELEEWYKKEVESGEEG
jgi:hypothetical protein